MLFTDPSSYVLAAGALGTASFALVDSSKVWNGGVSNCGFDHIRQAIKKLFPATGQETPPVPLHDMEAVLRANWLNGTSLADQKLIARTLVKLRLNPENASHLATMTGVDATLLRSVATKIADGQDLEKPEQNVFGRFDLILTTQLDEAYQRADQIYRNSAKAASVVVSIVLAFLGGWSVAAVSLLQYVSSPDVAVALLTGLVATPLAPVAKDLASGLTAATKAIGLLKK